MPLQRDARVVVVDDDTFFLEAMLVLLPQLGLAPVACAMDGAEAVAVVREHDPDVVLVDLEMPLVDGVEAIKEISRTSPEHDSSRRDRLQQTRSARQTPSQPAPWLVYRRPTCARDSKH